MPTKSREPVRGSPFPIQEVSVRNLSNSAWNVAGSLMYGAWLPPGMTTFRPALHGVGPAGRPAPAG